MFEKKRVLEILNNYNKDFTIATFCTHSSLQIFHGAKLEGFKTIGFSIGKQPKFYDAFPLAKPDEFIIFKSYKDILSHAKELIEKNVIIIPHGSFVEYLGVKNFENLGVPMFGNRKIIAWESSRKKEREWLQKAGLKLPKELEPEKIDRPVIVKYQGAKGGKGFFLAKNYNEFKKGLDPAHNFTIQEYIIGTRYYLHYFYSPIKESGYKLKKGSLELLSMDRRDETNIDEMYKIGSQEELKKMGFYPSFVVTGNVPLVIRESLLTKVFEMGENVVETSRDIGGMIGPFCLETVVTDKLEFYVFEISARIVAGTNPFISGSPYTDFIAPNLSTGRRIAQEIKQASLLNKLDEVIS